jgi:choline dehydrogenase-like flavoprotein
LQDDQLPMGTALAETYHYIGTTRMADDPSAGVTDRNCAVHGMQNLFVAGSSVFPTAGQANPTLTIVALAVRLADHLKN